MRCIKQVPASFTQDQYMTGTQFC